MARLDPITITGAAPSRLTSDPAGRRVVAIALRLSRELGPADREALEAAYYDQPAEGRTQIFFDGDVVLLGAPPEHKVATLVEAFRPALDRLNRQLAVLATELKQRSGEDLRRAQEYEDRLKFLDAELAKVQL